MAKHEMPETPDVSYIHNEGVAHEDTDMSLGGITKFVIHLILLVTIAAGLMWGLFKYLSTRETQIEERETPSTLLKRERPPADDPTLLFPTPKLQETPIPDLRSYNQTIEERLTYRWVDKEKGVVSIPIEEAKQKLLEKGIAATPASESTKEPGAKPIEGAPAADAGKPPAAKPPAKPAAPGPH